MQKADGARAGERGEQLIVCGAIPAGWVTPESCCRGLPQHASLALNLAWMLCVANQFQPSANRRRHLSKTHRASGSSLTADCWLLTADCWLISSAGRSLFTSRRPQQLRHVQLQSAVCAFFSRPDWPFPSEFPSYRPIRKHTPAPWLTVSAQSYPVHYATWNAGTLRWLMSPGYPGWTDGQQASRGCPSKHSQYGAASSFYYSSTLTEVFRAFPQL
jgi:hypothetical protein